MSVRTTADEKRDDIMKFEKSFYYWIEFFKHNNYDGQIDIQTLYELYKKVNDRDIMKQRIKGDLK